MSAKTTIYTHDAPLRHDTGPGHPECPARLEAVQRLFDDAPFAAIPQKRAQAAGTDQIARAHPLYYIEAIEENIPLDGYGAMDGDTIVSPGSWEAALRAAGAPCQAIDDIMAGATENAFCAMRPPGHHAEPTRAMGFCLFNNVFIGARYAQEKHGLFRIAIVDFDVHHGNGTDAMARAHDPENPGPILYLSSHQYPLFPMSGLPEDNEEYVQNWTLTEGSGSEEFRRLYEDKIFPALEDFKPDLLMISAGFDAHKDDPLAGLNLTEEDFGWATTRLKEIAALHANGRIVSLLEGGYNLEALRNSVAAHLKALADV